jgi:hypothetical protein
MIVRSRDDRRLEAEVGMFLSERGFQVACGKRVFKVKKRPEAAKILSNERENILSMVRKRGEKRNGTIGKSSKNETCSFGYSHILEQRSKNYHPAWGGKARFVGCFHKHFFVR